MNIDQTFHGAVGQVAGRDIHNHGPGGLWDLSTDALLGKRHHHELAHRRNRLAFYLNIYTVLLAATFALVVWELVSLRAFSGSALAMGAVVVWAIFLQFGLHFRRQRLQAENYHHALAIQAVDEVLHRRVS